MARRKLPEPEHDADVAVGELEEEAQDIDDAEREEGDDPRIRRMGEVYLNPDDRGGHSPGDIAARLSSPGTLTAQDVSWSAGANDPSWEAPRQPVQQIIKVLHKLEHVGGYRRPRDVFGDWLDLVEASLHMLPQQALHMRMHRQPMPPDQEPAEIQAVFKRVMGHYGKRWEDAQKLFHEAYHILTDAAHGMVFDALGAIYMALEIGNARAGQYFSPWAIARVMPEMIMADIEAEILDYIGEALDAWPGSEPYRFMGMQWGRAHPETTKYLWYKHLDPLYFMTQRFRVLEPCSGSGIFVLGAISVTPPWIVTEQLCEYYCVDIDPMCAQMTRINLCLYGANGYGLLCQLPLVAPDDELPTFEQLEHRYQQIASHVQCSNSLSHDWVKGDDGIWKMVLWSETAEGKRRIAERDQERAQEAEQSTVAKEQQKAVAKVKQVKEKAKAKGQEMLFDIELPPLEEREGLTADAAHTNGNGNGHTNGNGNGHAVPGAAGAWDTFVTNAKATKGTQAAAAGAAVAAAAVEELAETLTQGEMF